MSDTTDRATPRPWKIRPVAKRKKDFTPRAFVCGPEGEDMVLSPMGAAIARWEANKALIVRAVNAHDALLAACKAVLTRLDMESAERQARGLDDHFLCSAMRGTIRAAIDKAEGDNQ